MGQRLTYCHNCFSSYVSLCMCNILNIYLKQYEVAKYVTYLILALDVKHYLFLYLVQKSM